MKVCKSKNFSNGIVYALKTKDDYPIEVTDTFLPYYTKDAIGRKQNSLYNCEIGDRSERWMIGVSVMSGCPVGCKFCATAKLKKYRNLTADEIIEQVYFVIGNNSQDPLKSKEFKINFTRMGEPFLNIENVKVAISRIKNDFPNTHCYVSTIGIKNSDFSWITGTTTLQFSVHSFDENYRNWLIPYKNKMSLSSMGSVRIKSDLKTTINLTLVRNEDFDIQKLKQWFSPKNHFVKLSPVNPNPASDDNHIGSGIIKATNIK